MKIANVAGHVDGHTHLYPKQQHGGSSGFHTFSDNLFNLIALLSEPAFRGCGKEAVGCPVSPATENRNFGESSDL